MEIGDKVKCIDNDGIPDPFKLEIGKIYTIREIGDRTGGLRLEGVELYSDITGYEKCYGKKHFKVVSIQ